LFAPNTQQVSRKLVAATRQVMLRTKPEGIAAALHGLAQAAGCDGPLAKIDVPALVICGEHDAISPLTEMEQLAAKCLMRDS